MINGIFSIYIHITAASRAVWYIARACAGDILYVPEGFSPRRTYFRIARRAHRARVLYDFSAREARLISGRWQAPAAVLPEGPKDQVECHSRARRAREWLKPASPRARRARGRAKLSARFGACQCYYMFFTIQPKIVIFNAQLKHLNDGQNA